MLKTEYRRQIKTFRLKYIVLTGKVIRTARNVESRYNGIDPTIKAVYKEGGIKTNPENFIGKAGLR